MGKSRYGRWGLHFSAWDGGTCTDLLHKIAGVWFGLVRSVGVATEIQPGLGGQHNTTWQPDTSCQWCKGTVLHCTGTLHYCMYSTVLGRLQSSELENFSHCSSFSDKVSSACNGDPAREGSSPINCIVDFLCFVSGLTRSGFGCILVALGYCTAYLT